MVGARREMLADLGVDGLRGTVGNQGIDESVAAGTVDIGLREPVPQQVVGVVTQTEVGIVRRDRPIVRA